jgi:hypothetical protein
MKSKRSLGPSSRPKEGKVRFYGSRLAPIDIFSNLNTDYILRDDKVSPQERRKQVKKQKEKPLEVKPKAETRTLSFLEQRDALIDELFHSLRNHSKDLFDICEALVLSASEYTSLAFVVSESPILQISKEVSPSLISSSDHPQTFLSVLTVELPNYEHPEQIPIIFDVLDVERRGYVYVHQIIALVNFSRLHRTSSVDEIVKAVFEGVLWESAVLEQNCRPSASGSPKQKHRVTTYFGSSAMFSFEIYRKHTKRKELLESFHR